jgi:hypothetical protein
MVCTECGSQEYSCVVAEAAAARTTNTVDVSFFRAHVDVGCDLMRNSNIFNPYEQADLVNAITEYYGFSPRLSKVITTPPVSRQTAPLHPVRLPSRRRDRILGRGSSAGDESGQRDVEALQSTPSVEHLRPLTREPMNVGDVLEMAAMENATNTGAKMNYMNLVQNVWHFHAVEWGGRCKEYLARREVAAEPDNSYMHWV